METLFLLYWRFLGAPLSRVKGTVADATTLNLSELLLWLGLFCSLTIILRLTWLKAHFESGRYSFSWRNPLLLLLGPGLLLLLASGQGALPFFLNPTGMRPSLYRVLSPPDLHPSHIKTVLDTAVALLHRDFDSRAYQKLTEENIIKECNQMLDHYLQRLDLPSGRTVKNIKTLQGLSRVMGLSYGGPAYHDPLTGEVGMASPSDLPTSKGWRVRAICHEIAHAKGYGREIDAEILTQMALLSSAKPVYRSLGFQMILQKSGIKYHSPLFLQKEAVEVTRKRQAVSKEQYLITWLKKIARKTSLNNKAEKYGNVSTLESIPPDHPYFATVIHLFQKTLASHEEKIN